MQSTSQNLLKLRWLLVTLIINLIYSATPIIIESVSVQQPRIVIIGAGPSGIAAASKLLQNGFINVTLLEAEDRIGGRVHTVDFGEYKVDLGAQWVHGQDGNIVYELANPLGLLEVPPGLDDDSSIIFFNSSGQQLNETMNKELEAFFLNNILDPEVEDDSTWLSRGDFIKSEYDRVFKNGVFRLDTKNYLRTLELLVVAEEASENWDELPVSDNEYTEYPGYNDVNWKEQGYSNILDILMKKYPNPEEEIPIINNTFLNTEVTNISWGCEENEGIKINTSNGKMYMADHAIVTVSLGVLKQKYETFFTPSLPDEKIKAIKGIEYGSVAKVILLFEKPFWNLNGKLQLTMAVIWDDAQRASLENTDKEWLLGSYGFDTIEHKPNLLLCWVLGKHAKMMEALPEDKVFSHVVEMLHNFLDKSYNVTDPIAMIRTQWYSNPHFRGTYSYRSRDTVAANALSSDIEKPLDENNLKLLFAGEAASHHRFSTVDGAIDAGWLAANKLIEHYSDKKMKI